MANGVKDPQVRPAAELDAERSAPAAAALSFPGRAALLALAWVALPLGMTLSALARDRHDALTWFGLGLLAMLGACKVITLIRTRLYSSQRWSWGRLLAYCCWVGMQPEPFFRREASVRRTAAPAFRAALFNMSAGALLLWLLSTPLAARLPPWAVVALGMLGYYQVFIFGFTDAGAALYRWCSIPVDRVWQNPLAATSLADLWGRRWNLAFSGFARNTLFYPVGRVLGARAAALTVFLFSGLLHEWLFGMTVGGSYGRPTLYFLLQGLFAQVESSRTGRRLLRRRPWMGRLWTALVVIVPLPLLFYPAFVAGWAVPLLTSLGMEGLR